MATPFRLMAVALLAGLVPGVLAAMRDIGRAIARRCPLSDPLPSVEA